MIFVEHGREGMVRRHPALIFFVPFEHREVDHPEEFQDFGIEELVPVVVFLGDLQPQLAAGEQHSSSGQRALRLAGPAREHQQVVFGGA